MIQAILVLALGFYVLVKGADWFVEGASSLACYFHIPQLVIGLTICAMGTSLPEASVSLVAAIHDNAQITIGNVVGSNILNILIILGISSLITRLKIQKSTFLIEIPFMLFSTLALLIMSKDEVITFNEGMILGAFFLGYLFYLYFLSRKNEEQEESKHSLLVCFTLILLGIFFVIIGSHLVVNSATSLSTMIGLSKRFIGLTVVAFGTSLPELVTSVVAAKKGQNELALGNVIGSNIFNILFVLGIAGTVNPLTTGSQVIIDAIVMMVATVVVFGFALTGKIKRSGGISLLVMYAAYLTYLIVRTVM